MSEPDSFLPRDVALAIADLGMVTEASETGALGRLTEVAARTVAGCVAATAVRWGTQSTDAGPKPLECVSSHPDLAELNDVQIARRAGPLFDAVRDETMVFCNDTLVETRWPAFTAGALRRGVRCFAASVHRRGTVVITLTFYGVLPGALDPRQMSLGALLAAQGGAAVTNTSRYEDVHRTAVQLQRAVETRAVVDQAKGIIMHALGCGADEAFAELRRISQTRHVKLTALAHRIVTGHGLSEDKADLAARSDGG